jgi:hypothetical protein
LANVDGFDAAATKGLNPRKHATNRPQSTVTEALRVECLLIASADALAQFLNPNIRSSLGIQTVGGTKVSVGLVSLFIAAWFVVSVSSPALAYLDPMTGSFLIQGLIAGAVAVMAAVRSVRERLLTALGLRKPEPQARTSEQAEAASKPVTHDVPRT